MSKIFDYVKSLWEPFLIGGSVIAGSKLVSKFAGPALGPLVGGMPTGIISSYFLTGHGAQDKKRKYFAGYAYSSFVLFLAILFTHLVSAHTDYNVDIISTFALVVWALISYFLIVRAGLTKKK